MYIHVYACVCVHQEQGAYVRKHSYNRHNVGNQCLGRPQCKRKCGLTKSQAYIKREGEYPSPMPPPTIYKVTYEPKLHAQLPDSRFMKHTFMHASVLKKWLHGRLATNTR